MSYSEENGEVVLRKTKRCKSISPLSGLRCGLKSGHKGSHKCDAYELKKYVDSVVADTFKTGGPK